MQQFVSYRVNGETERKLGDDAENNTALASAGSSNPAKIESLQPINNVLKYQHVAQLVV